MNAKRALPFCLLLSVVSLPAAAGFTIDFDTGINVSDTPEGTARSDYAMVVDPDSLGKIHVVTYADGTNGERDIYVRHSTDDGQTWSPAVNLSNTAAQTNIIGEPGNSRRPSIVSADGRVLIAWVDTYCPGGAQGSFISNEGGPTAFGCIYVARSADAGRTWSPGEQLTDGSRDAINPYPAASPSGVAVAWQEDPEGVEGGGDLSGASGASGSPGTDIHYAALSSAGFDASTAFTAATVVTDNTGTSQEDPAATRPNLQLVGTTAMLGYEEKKSGAQGKNVHLHTFGFLSPDSGAAGDVVNDVAENARRVRIVVQPAARAGASDTRALVIWRQGLGTQNAPADLILRRAVGGYSPADLLPAVNLSAATLSSPTNATPDDSIRGHRAILDGDRVGVVYIYTPSEPLRALQQANYNATTRHSRDGGVSWSAPRNVSNVEDTTINAFAPRIVGTPPTIATGDPLDERDPDAFVVGWDTRTNTIAPSDATRLDAFVAVTGDFGQQFSEPIPVADSISQEFELGLQLFPSGRVLCAIWKQRDPDRNPDTWFRCGVRNFAPVIVPVNSWAALLGMIILVIASARWLGPRA